MTAVGTKRRLGNVRFCAALRAKRTSISVVVFFAGAVRVVGRALVGQPATTDAHGPNKKWAVVEDTPPKR
jgi:hypothetical protein